MTLSEDIVTHASTFHYLSAAISCTFLICLPIRFWKQQAQQPKGLETRSKYVGFHSWGALGWNGRLQITLSLLLALLELSVLAADTGVLTHRRRDVASSFLASGLAALGFGGALLLQRRILSFPSHGKPGLSDLVVLYLLLAVLCDGVLLTAPFPGEAAASAIVNPSRAMELVMSEQKYSVLRLRCFTHLVLLILTCFGGGGGGGGGDINDAQFETCWSTTGTDMRAEGEQEKGQENTITGTPNRSPSSDESANILSRIFFFWINPILVKGYRRILNDEDLPALGHDLSARATRESILANFASAAATATESTAFNEKTKTRMPTSPSRLLALGLFKTVRKPFLAAILPRLILTLLRFSQPLLIKRSIRFAGTSSPHDRPAGENDRLEGYFLVLSALVVYTGTVVCTSLYHHRLNRLKLAIRSSLVGLIHDKVMRSPTSNITAVTLPDGKTSQCRSQNHNLSAEATALVTTDAESLDASGEMLHEAWAQTLEVALGMILLSRELGPYIWPLPLLFVFFCSRFSLSVTRGMRARQREWNGATQDRLAATASLLGHMKQVKMLGLQGSLAAKVERLRAKEMEAAGRVRWMMVCYNLCANALGIFSPVLTMVVFALLPTSGASGGAGAKSGGGFVGRMGTETAFTSLAILTMVMHPANMVMTIMPRVNAALAGLDRVGEFLGRKGLDGVDHREEVSPRRCGVDSDVPAVEVEELSAGVLRGVTMAVPRGSVTLVSGPVGSGKSTLLAAILGEVRRSSGFVRVSTKKMAYCAQDPWLPTGTIKQIICGADRCDMEDTGSGYDTRWYRTVTEACCLAHDFNTLPDGDETRVGSRGLNLSGGQRQRIALARAVYARCEIALLDDPFSALDGDTEKRVLANLLGPRGLFRQCQTALVVVASSIEYFSTADNVVILDGGRIRAQGNWHAIQEHRLSQGAKHAIVKHQGGRASRASQGEIDSVVTPRTKESDNMSLSGKMMADLPRQTRDWAIYRYYFGDFVGWSNLLLLVGCAASYGFFITIPQHWLRLWTESSSGGIGDNSSPRFYLAGYLMVSVLSWLSAYGNIRAAILHLAPQSGLRIHQRLLQIVTGAPLSFFLATDSGAILNRFSQDIQYVDKQLPLALSALANQIFKLVMQSILLFSAQRLLVLSVPACMAVVHVVQKVYLRTSRQLRLLELESRSAVVNNFLESVEGLATLRAFGWDRREATQQNVSCLEKSQRPEYLLLCLQRWLNVVLDMVAAAVATSVIALVVASRLSQSGAAAAFEMSGGRVGVALNVMLVANKTLLQLVECWANLEVSLGAVTRLKSLEESTESEEEHDKCLDPGVRSSSWPSRGGPLEFRNDVCAVHYPSGAVGLRGINLSIQPGQKLIIHGRTGSGKSSLLLSLLGMLEVQHGKIELDGVDISQVPPEVLRRRCFVTVSQDALLFSDETLRFNLDPDGTALPDAFIVDELVTTGIWSHFCAGNDTTKDFKAIAGTMSPLDMTLSQFPELSAGQRQLFALCRALVKAKTLRRVWGVRAVVLLDEVTSSLDAETETTIQRIIDREFTGQGHTVIVVTHRLFDGGDGGGNTTSGDTIVVNMADGEMQRVR